MSFALEGKTALVTGASRGIGRAIGEKLAADGATVIINYARNQQPAQELVSAIVAKGGKAVAIQADVSKPAEVRRLFGEAEKAIGPLDVVIANAGVYLSKPLIESTEADYDYVFDINTRGVFFTLQEAARRVRDGGRPVEVPAAVGERVRRDVQDPHDEGALRAVEHALADAPDGTAHPPIVAATSRAQSGTSLGETTISTRETESS